MMMKRALPMAAVLALGCGIAGAAATTGRQAVLDHFAALARQEDPHFKAFSAAAGQAFFLAHPGTGRPDTPSCSTCHTTNPRNEGRTRAGKLLDPMAVSRTPSRFTDLAKVEKWFRRNCNTVYGRECTAEEEGNFITFMASE